MEQEFGGQAAEEGKRYNIRHRAFYFARDLTNLMLRERIPYICQDYYRQVLDSGGSIGANLVEGIAGASKKDFLNFNRIALKSANETKFWLKLLIETVGKDKAGMKVLLEEATAISKIIATIIINAQNGGAKPEQE